MGKKQTINQQETLCFVAGKSGGHLIPCLTIAQQYIKKNKNIRFLFFSNNTSLDEKIISNKSVINHHIKFSLSSFAYKKIHRYPQIIAQLFYSFFVSLYYLYKYKPKQIMSTGGFIALPICFAAFFLRIPIILYELNAIPGKSIKFFAPFAQTIWYCFDETEYYLPKHKRQKKDYPIRFSPSLKLSTVEAKKKLSLSSEKKTVTILGGSQGSLFINKLVKQWLLASPQLHPFIQLIHQTGIYDTHNWEKFYQSLSISALVFSYQDDPALYYNASDLILCRAGAGTLFEVYFFGKRCITIPLETTTTSHQCNNAYAMANKYPQHFSVLEQKTLIKNPGQLFTFLDTFYKNQNF